MPWITIRPGTIVMNLNASEEAYRFGVTIDHSPLMDEWEIKWHGNVRSFLKTCDFIPILHIDEDDSPDEMSFRHIWDYYGNRVHAVVYALFAQQIRNQAAVDEFRRFLPDFRRP